MANCGGLLTPLGDPPLFLGMLRGVPFLWTFSLLKEWIFVNGLLRDVGANGSGAEVIHDEGGSTTAFARFTPQAGDRIRILFVAV